MKIKNSEEELNENLNKQEEKRKKLVSLESKLQPIILIITAAIIAIFGLIGLRGMGLIIPSIVIIIISSIAYLTSIYSPFNTLANNSRIALLKHFMTSYYPNVKYRYSRRSRLGHRILKSVRLLSYDLIHEEDVIEGMMDKAHFYISEIRLSKKKNNSRSVIFEGMLFRLKIPGRNFPRTEIVNRVDYGVEWMNKMFYEGIGKIFSNTIHFKTDPSNTFMYKTKNEERFREELRQLIPFIEFLSSKKSSVRILAQGDEITMILADKVDFLDEPAFKLKQSFFNKEYNNNMGKQLNSLFYILETFIKNTDTSEIKEQLELKELELMKDMETIEQRI